MFFYYALRNFHIKHQYDNENDIIGYQGIFIWLTEAKDKNIFLPCGAHLALGNQAVPYILRLLYHSLSMIKK